MKKLSLLTIVLLLFAATFISCKDKIELPKLTVAFEKETYAVELGETITLTPVVANAENAKYSWKIEGKEISTNKELIFTPEDAKEYVITLTLIDEFGQKAEAICKVNSTNKPPVVKFNTVNYDIESDESITITPTVENDINATYSWKLGGKEISTEKELVFTPEEATEYVITLIVTNEDGKTGEATCNVNVTQAPPFKSAFFLLDAGRNGKGENPLIHARLSAINFKGELISNAIALQNGDAVKAGVECILPVISDGKIYVPSTIATSDRSKSEVIILDALTLKYEKTVNFEVPSWFDQMSGFMPIGGNKAYVTVGEEGEVYILDLNSGEMSEETLADVPKDLGASTRLPLQKVGSYVYGVSSHWRRGTDICYIDTKTNAAKSVNISGEARTWRKGKDDNLLIVMKNPSRLVVFSTKTNEIVGEPVPLKYDSRVIAADPNNDIIFINYSDDAEEDKIYRFNYKENKEELFATIPEKMLDKNMLVHPVQNKLFFTFRQSYPSGDSKTYVFDPKAEAPTKSINAYDHKEQWVEFLTGNF